MSQSVTLMQYPAHFTNQITGHIDTERPAPDGALDWDTVRSALPTETYPPRVQLHQQGDRLRYVYFVQEGWLKLSHVGTDGHEAIVRLASSGDFAGSWAVLADRPSPIIAITLSRCDLVRIPAAVFRELVNDDPELSRQLLRLNAAQMLEQFSHSVRLASRSPRRRLECMLRQLARSAQRRDVQVNIRLALPLKRYEIAAMIAVTPEHLSRLLSEMEEEGLIRRDNGWVVVADLNRLNETFHPE